VREIGLFIGDKFPGILADEACGVVVKAGKGVTRFKEGDVVFGHLDIFDHADTGGLQEYTLIDEDCAAPLPNNITPDQAVTIPVNLIPALIGFFDESGFGLPCPFPGFGTEREAKAFPYAETTILINGGGANTGKLAIQLAHLAGFGRIATIASKSNEAELKSFGATDVIDRHGTDEEVRARVHAVLGNDITYIYDVLNLEHSFPFSLLPNDKKGYLICLKPFALKDESKLAEKKAGYKAGFITGRSQNKPHLTEPFWNTISAWIEEGKIRPLKNSVIKGLDADAVNKLLDDYVAGKNPGKYHVHPSE
jgi:NADPH:quinone reductase